MSSTDSADPAIVRWAAQRLDTWSSTVVAAVATIMGLVAGAVVIAAYWLLLVRLGDPAANNVLQFAGTRARVAERGGEFTLEAARTTQLWGLLFSVVWGAVGYLLFSVFWKHCWNAGLAAKQGVISSIRYMPLAGAAISIVERLVTLASVRQGPTGVEMLAGMPAVVVTLAWAKWVLGGMTILAVIGMIVAAGARASQSPLPPGWADEFRRNLADGMSLSDAHDAADAAVIDVREGESSARAGEGKAVLVPPRVDEHIDLERTAITAVPIEFGPTGVRPAQGASEHLEHPSATGICCSGGGIRAAGFALGALSALERTPADVPLRESILGSADYLSSVSGGGYAAASWRIGAGTGALPEEPIIGDPSRFDPEVEPFPTPDRPAPDLLTHIRERRSFLANGPGGLPRSVLLFVVQTAFHMSLIIASVYVLAWPFGKLLGTWAVQGLERESVASMQLDAATGTHQWIPPVLLLIAIAPLAIVRLFLDRTRVRRIVDMTMMGLAALAAGAAFVLLALPWLVEFVVEIIPAGGGNRLAFTGVWATIVTAIWQLAKRFVRKNIKLLGGVFLALGLLAFAAFVIDWSYRNTNTLGQWPVFALVFGFLVIAFVFFNPDTWSLHEFYRRQLTGTFATQRRDDGFYTDVMPPPMSHYLHAEGPRSIICCAAAREVDADTGVASVSMTFEPDNVTLYTWKRTPGSQLAHLDPMVISHREFTRLLPAGGDRLASLMGAAAVSGAAVAPAMGRKNMATTNALLAAFNARLGMWVPNPAYGAATGRADIDRRVSPRLVNMFKEILGVYDEKDPNVYATDGGHWDNLGLVELIRRRCATIIAIDTSGDKPGTYTALKEAIALARHECGAEVSFPDDQWAQLEVGEDGLVARNHMVGTVTYRDGHEANLLYVKGAVAQTSSLAIQRYAAGDRTFPNYSTGNQMLSDRRLTFLVRLGDESMRDALAEHPRIVTAALAGLDADAGVTGVGGASATAAQRRGSGAFAEAVGAGD